MLKQLEAAFDQFEIITNVEYNVEDKLHRLISIVPSNVYQQLSTIMPLECWKYQNVKATNLDMLNIAFRFQTQETINQGRRIGLSNIEEEHEGECGEGCGCDQVEFRGYDVNTYEEVDLLEHINSGNVVSEFTIDALDNGTKGGQKGSGKKGNGSEITAFKCGREGHRQAECRSTTIHGKGKRTGKGKRRIYTKKKR